MFVAVAKTHRFLSKWNKVLGLILLIGSSVLVTEPFWNNSELVYAQNPNQEIQLVLSNSIATLSPTSNIYAVNGREEANISNLLSLMAQNGLDFYSIIRPNDVVLIKINCQWPERGGTDTDVLKQLIAAVVAHPQGFTGEVVVADNGQWTGSMNWPNSNAEDITQSTQDVVDMFSANYKVSTYGWSSIRGTQVDEYSNGNYTSGYILNNTANTETGIKVSYPKFQTAYGTYISFKKGIWNGTTYEERLKIINLPVLKSHSEYGVTASVKNYMGVQSEGESALGGLANGHLSVALGGMGTLMAETRMPTLNILCAIWINAIPQNGPQTSYTDATRTNVLAASTDPAALDYWASKHILVQAAQAIGIPDTHTLNPDSTDKTGLTEALGIWLPKSRDALLRAGYQVTTNEQQMNVYVLNAEIGYNLNLHVKDWDLTDNIEGALVYKDSDVKTSDANGWANWTDATGTVAIKVDWFGGWVNGTFSVTMDSDKTIDVRCNIFDIGLTCVEDNNQALLQNANVTATAGGSKVASEITNSNGGVNLVNVPNGTLTFSVYDANNNVIANTTRTIVSEGQSETITCNQNYVTLEINWQITEVWISNSLLVPTLMLTMGIGLSYSMRYLKKRLGMFRLRNNSNKQVNC